VKFPLEVVERVKEKVGGRLLFYRLGSDDLDPSGTQIEDSQKFAAKLEEAGVNIIERIWRIMRQSTRATPR